MKIEVPDEWAEHRAMGEVLKRRDEFVKEFGDANKCTCERCGAALICNLAYDSYNTNGDCLLDK
jgi:hypothetical protein